MDKKVEGRYKKAIQEILKTNLRDALGTIETDVEVLPCILVTNKNKTKAVDAVITQLVKELSK